MRVLLLSTTLFALGVGVSPARADDYPVLGKYESLAQELIAQTQTAATATEVGSVQARTRNLLKLGVEIMQLYAEKNPNCLAQFDQMVAELPEVETLTLTAIHDRYHDGKGLPTAPRHCYFGRSQVVHPALNVVRLSSDFSERVRQDVLADLEEVIEHLKPIQRNLDNPPN